MVVTLFLVGGIMALAGLLGVGYGLAIEGLSFGSTTILGGSIGLAGGIIVIGLGATIRELRRLGRQLERAAPRPRPADVDGAVRGAGRGLPARPQPAATTRRSPDQRPVVPPQERAPAEPERMRPASPSSARDAEPPVVDEEDLVPLSPAGIGRTSPRLPTGLQDDGMVEPRFESPPSPRPPSRFDIPRAPEPERPKRNLFDTSWQSPGSASARAQPERRTPDPEPEPEPPVEEPAATKPDEPAPAPQEQPQPSPAAILKSGVIDGMAYTLYTDGSIEAQLPNGIMRFESIDELRSHLERNS
jgi:hypothetical protein